MKNDPVFSSIIGFIIPIFLIYGCFFFVESLNSGVFSIFYSTTLLIATAMIFYIFFSDLKLSIMSGLLILRPIIFCIALGYILALLFFIIGFIGV